MLCCRGPFLDIKENSQGMDLDYPERFSFYTSALNAIRQQPVAQKTKQAVSQLRENWKVSSYEW